MITQYRPLILFVAALFFTAATWLHGYGYGKRTERAKTAELQRTLDTLAERTKEAERAARTATDTLQDRIKDANAKYQAAEKENDRLSADLARALKRGTVRLSDTWRCPATSAGSARPDAAEAASARQADSFERIVKSTAADEAALDWVYARWESERRAVIAAGCAVERQ